MIGNDQFSLSETPQDDVIPLSQGTSPVPTEKATSQRAMKADYALGSSSPGAPAITTSIQSGSEGDLRQSLSMDETMKLEQAKTAMVQRLAAQTGGKLSDEDAQTIFQMTQQQFQSEPSTILEKKFADKYTSDTLNTNASNPNGVMAKAATQPYESSDHADVYNDVIKSNEYEKTQLENLQSEWQKTGWGAAAADYMGQLVPLLQTWRLHNALSQAPTSTILPGENLGQQIAYLKALPSDERRRQYDATIQDLKSKNMLTAMDFARAVVSFNSTDAISANLMAAADVAGVGDLAAVAAKGFVKAGGRVFRQAVKTAEDAVPTVANVAEKHAYDDAALNEMRQQADLPKPYEHSVYVHQGFSGTIKDADVGAPVATRVAGKDIPINKNTVYVSQEDAEKLRPVEGSANRVVTFKDGSIARSVQQPDGQWSIPFDSGRVSASDTPREGLVPVELNDMKNIVGSKVYSDVSVHGPIERVIPDIRLYSDNQKAGMIEHSAQPFENSVEVRVGRNTGKNTNNVTFGSPVHPVEFREVPSTPVGDLKVALKDGIKAVADPEVDPVKTLEGLGDTTRAAQVRVSTDIAKMQSGEATDVFGTLPSASNPRDFFGTARGLSREFSQRIVNEMTNGTNELTSILGEVHVPRGTSEAIQRGISEATDKLKAEYGGRINDGIIDFLHVPPEMNPNKVNVDTLVMRVGNTNGLPFTDRASAEFARENIYGLTKDEAGISQKGTSFYITVARHIDETSLGFRDALVTPQNSTPVSSVNMLLNRLRSTEDLLSEVQRDARHIATHTPNRVLGAIRDQLESTLNKLSRRENKEVERVLIRNRDWVDPNTGQRGRFFTSGQEFETDFLSSIGHLPTPEQTAHYFNYTRLSDFDWTMRNQAIYRDLAREGIREFSWKTPNGPLPWIKAKELDGLPWGGQDASIWLYEGGTKEGRLLYKHDMVNRPGGITKAGMEDLINNKGFKVYQVHAPTERPLQGLLTEGGQKVNEQIHFIVTNTMENRALAFNQLPYSPGVHSIYPDPWFVKAPMIETGRHGRPTYYGDRSLMNFASEAQARKYAQAFDKARLMLKTNDPNLDTFLASNLPYSPQDFKQMFYKGHISLDNPVTHTYTGRTTFDTSEAQLKQLYPDIVDATKSEWNLAAGSDRAFQADRDLVLNSVREGPGTFHLAPSRQLDPYIALNRALGQSVRNLWMGDYKTQAVQHWIQEFGDVMKPDYKTLANNPNYFLYHPQWNEGTTDKALLAAAKTSQRSIVNFVGSQSEIASQVTYLQNKLISTIYDKFGQRASEIVADHALPAIKDPAKYVRAVAFHTKLGLFNPIQLVVQSQSLAHVIAVAGPQNGGAGFIGGFLSRRLLHTEDPAIIDHFANMATKFGWKAQDFKDMIELQRKVGIDKVGAEVAMRDDVVDPKLFRSTVGRFFDKGALFFNEGERIVRLAAFATAFREWKIANPALELTNREVGKIMTRSDLLSVNMTRASSASWQTGLASVPLQFQAFNARLAEQFLGKRLTVAEKARAFATYSALYGVPTAGAGAVGLWPFYDDIKGEAQKRGINLSPTYLKGLMEGLPELALKAITGNDYNIAQRLGPNGSNIFHDAITGEKSISELIGGASGSIISDIWSTSDPVRRAIAGAFTGNSEHFPLKASDAMNVLNNISTAQLGSRLLGWKFYGKFITKNGTSVGPMDGMDAAMAVLGLTNQSITDGYLKQKDLRSDQKSQKPYEDNALREWQLAVQAGASGDEQGFRDRMTRVRAYIEAGDFNVEQQQSIYRKAMKFRPDLIDKINWDFVRKSPNSQYDSRFESYFVNKKGTQ